MELDHDLCYSIIQSRDERYDGRFFTAVLTTGVYCRPICPARTPRSENVRFFSCAAAAEEAGFRPCLRCRPEASPGTPAWMGASAIAARALQLIEEGVLDHDSVDDLAARLHLGARQLRRLFMDQLGVPPVAVAQTRRVQFAKKLLNETALPISDIAFSAGFASIRRFNAAMQTTYQRTPSELRGRSKPPTDQAVLQLKLSYRPPYNWPQIARFLAARVIPGVEVLDEHGYRRTIRIGDRAGVLQVEPNANHFLLTVPSAFSPDLLAIVERVRRLFDLKADPVQIANHLGHDARLTTALDRVGPGVRVPGAWDGFETAVRVVLGQQISVRGATTLSGRIVAAYGDRLDTGYDGLCALYPYTARLIDAPLEQLGLPHNRAATIRELARQVNSGELTFSTAAGLDEAITRLCQIPGIGPWTAHMIAMRCLAEPDAYPASDLILQRAISDSDQPEYWRPWRAYAAVTLWAENTMEEMPS